MKKLLRGIFVSAGLLLGACTPDLAAIQAATVQACGFVPTAVTIASMFPTPYTIPASAIATAICEAVIAQVPKTTRRQLARRGAAGATTSVTINVGGTPIVVSGYFVR